MKRVVCIGITLSLAIAPTQAQDFNTSIATTTGDGAGYAGRDATVLSMMGWGISLAVGIAALCALIDNNTSSHSH